MSTVAIQRPRLALFISDGSGDYRRERLRREGADPEHAAPPEQPLVMPSIAEASQFPQLTSEQQLEIQTRTKCLADFIEQHSPLLEGEKVESDFFSYLTASHGSLPVGTAVLRRKTNQAELLYFVQNVGVTPSGDLVTQSASLAPTEDVVVARPPEVRLRGKPSFVAKLGKTLASSLASKLGGFIGDLIWNAIFPEKSQEEYFQELYDDIVRRFKTEAANQIKGTLSTILDGIANEYRPRKVKAEKAGLLNDRKTRKDLFTLLQKYDAAFYGTAGMLGTMMQPEYAIPGYSNFLFGAGLRLFVFQQMAAVDPQNANNDGTWKSPNESSYATTVSNSAQQFIRYAQETWPKVQNDRTQHIKVIRYSRSKIVARDKIDIPYIKVVDGDRVIDDHQVRGEIRKDGGSADVDATNSYAESYKQGVLRDLADDFGQPTEIIANWKTLVTTPVPM